MGRALVNRVRDQFVGERTALMKQFRAIPLERGYVVAQGWAKLAACLTELLDTGAGSSLTPRMRTLVAEVPGEVRNCPPDETEN